MSPLLLILSTLRVLGINVPRAPIVGHTRVTDVVALALVFFAQGRALIRLGDSCVHGRSAAQKSEIAKYSVSKVVAGILF